MTALPKNKLNIKKRFSFSREPGSDDNVGHRHDCMMPAIFPNKLGMKDMRLDDESRFLLISWQVTSSSAPLTTEN